MKSKDNRRHRPKNAIGVHNYQRRAKQKLIDYKGGKCEICGYRKDCPGAYHFHHIEPSKKSFTISQKCCMAFESLKKEVDKCQLLCANCHAETHDKIYAETRERARVEHEEYSKSRGRVKEIKCPTCNLCVIQTWADQKYCSNKCAKVYLRKVSRPLKNELSDLIKSKITWTSLGKKFNVTDNTVRKWAIQYGLEVPTYRKAIEDRYCDQCNKTFKPEHNNDPQKYCSLACYGLASRICIRPTKDELIALMASKSLIAIGEQFGVNWCTVRDWAIAYSIHSWQMATYSTASTNKV